MKGRFPVILIGVALLVLAVAPAALAGPNGTNRPFKGSATGEALYGYEDGQGTYGLSNVFDCDEGSHLEDPEEAGFYRVTTFASADGTASHLGRVHLEFAHCPHPDTGPVDGQLGIVAANGDVLYGEYHGTEDGILVTFLPERTEARPFCGLLNGVPCESTGRFAAASGTALLQADAAPTDEEDPFVPWSWWGNWRGMISY